MIEFFTFKYYIFLLLNISIFSFEPRNECISAILLRENFNEKNVVWCSNNQRKAKSDEHFIYIMTP